MVESGMKAAVSRLNTPFIIMTGSVFGRGDIQYRWLMYIGGLEKV